MHFKVGQKISVDWESAKQVVPNYYWGYIKYLKYGIIVECANKEGYTHCSFSQQDGTKVVLTLPNSSILPFKRVSMHPATRIFMSE